jgi:phosphoserine phosphatase RsbX
MQKIDYHIMKRALTGLENECGDTGVVRLYDGHCFIALIDVLGHGKEAFDVAVTAEAYLLNHYEEDLKEIMKGLHTHLKGSRGAVATICRLNLETGVMNYSGVGNISVKRFGTRTERLISKDGVIGYMMSSPMEKQTKFHPGDILILSSDGIKEYFNVDDFPGILTGNARNITTGFLEQLGKNNDDASCIALRYGI